MRRHVKTLVLSLALIGGAVTAGVPAIAADVTVGVGGGGIAFGYNDGYWDRAHSWHAWQNREEADRWREANRDHYYDWKHDRDGDKGWRQTDRYWDHR